MLSGDFCWPQILGILFICSRLLKQIQGAHFANPSSAFRFEFVCACWASGFLWLFVSCSMVFLGSFGFSGDFCVSVFRHTCLVLFFYGFSRALGFSIVLLWGLLANLFDGALTQKRHSRTMFEKKEAKS